MSTVQGLYTVPYSQEWLEDFFSKNYYKKPYDRFMWWRSYTAKTKPLHKLHPLRDKILNGDFDYAPFKLEAMLVEHRLNQQWIEGGHKDPGKFFSETSVDKARRKRLLEDFDKEETRRLADLKREFLFTFKITSDQYEDEMTNSDTENLIEFYYYIEEKYGTRAIKPKSIPRF